MWIKPFNVGRSRRDSCDKSSLRTGLIFYLWLWKVATNERRQLICNIISSLNCWDLVQLSTHWGWVTHICVSKLTIIGSDNGLMPGWRQAIIWTNAGIFLIGPLGTNFSEISIEINTFPFMKIYLNMLSAKRWSFCLSLNVLIENKPWRGIYVSSERVIIESGNAFCHLFGTKPLPQPMLKDYQLAILNQNANSSYQANAFENAVCKMLAILFRPQWKSTQNRRI